MFKKVWIIVTIFALLLAACAAPVEEAEEPAEEEPAAEEEEMAEEDMEEEEPAEEEEMAEEDMEEEEPAEEEEMAEEDMEEDAMAAVDLDAVKAYTVENAVAMQEATTELNNQAQQYFDIVEAAGFDYEAAFAENGEELSQLVFDMRASWLSASEFYELDEGIVAGVGELADFDTWIDAGPTGEEAPDEAYQWTLELPDGTTLENPGNLFHTLLEPTLYGTNPDFVGAEVDLDSDGEVTFTEALPEANILLGSTQALDGATAEMNAAIDAWEPTLEDAFGALVVMTPTMNEYFEQWKFSAFIQGEEQSFVATSRLFDITNILNGLDLTYDNIAPLVVEADPELDSQIQDGYDELITYVGGLYQEELDGRVFTAEEADLLGTEAQSQAETLSALVAQAAEESGVTLELE